MMESYLKMIDGLSKWTGKWVAWVIIPNVLALVYEVVARTTFLIGPTGRARIVSPFRNRRRSSANSVAEP